MDRERAMENRNNRLKTTDRKEVERERKRRRNVDTERKNKK